MSSQLISLAWNDHHRTLVRVFKKLLVNNHFVDCTIAAEGQKMKAHRVILSAFSPFFELVFSEETENNPTVNISGISFRDMRALVDFMYQGKLEVAENRIQDLIDAAKFLQIEGIGGRKEERMERKEPSTLTAPTTRLIDATATRNTRFENSTEDSYELYMNLEADRLRTFAKWPVQFISPSSMASAGFYYLNKADFVRCPFCSVELGCWEEKDNPMEEHKRWRPACPFIIGRTARNGAETNANFASRNSVNDECGLYRVEIRPNSGPENGKRSEMYSLEELGINTKHGPRYVAYISSNARMKSFDSWPMSLKQQPEELTEAGFFYTGEDDYTLCFYCGGGLKNWQPTDDPWIEHCKWFPFCTFAVLNKGKPFIEKILSEKQPVIPSEDIKNLIIEKRKAEAHPANLCSKSLHELAEASSASLNDDSLCKICFKEELGVVFLPCGHLVACVKCALAVMNCPICRKPFTATVRAHLA